ncbi:hypothetical protein X777_01402 [Ooceraea biroi]|uniref:Uncharacterized protein n=1 Tax=Ooceraea biroi TaxID=2015173 RepID=A0A026WQS5_OOCBI|nr:hypothetical protein X777_01402 [Ooceraea biroi]
MSTTTATATATATATTPTTTMTMMAAFRATTKQPNRRATGLALRLIDRSDATGRTDGLTDVAERSASDRDATEHATPSEVSVAVTTTRASNDDAPLFQSRSFGASSSRAFMVVAAPFHSAVVCTYGT